MATIQPLDTGEPTVVGPYRLLGRLGAGGMGRVYLGRSTGGRTVAVKIVHPHFALDEEFRARFRREVDAARRVGGAWTAPVLDADPDAQVPWVATAYAAGPSLAAAIAGTGALPPHTVKVLGAGLSEALTAVHALGLVHRDVKPSNVLLTVDGPLLIDFGIARATDGTASLTSTGVSVGSPGYMSPEQILGKGVGGAADVFSLGAVLAYAATGAPPFQGDSSATLLYKVVHEEPELGALDGELRELVDRCLHKDPTRRPTPEDIARTLAPEGAARLVASGWLPGPLVEQVGRSAVQLLNLEAADAPASGPVEFSSPSVGGPSGAAGSWSPAPGPAPTVAPGAGAHTATGAPAVAGVFGPPPVMPATDAANVPPPRTDPAGAARAAGSGPEDAVPPQPGKLSVSVAATSAPAANGRGRRVSCTVALAVAGAFAGATVGAVFMLGPLDDGRENGASSGSDRGDKDPAPSASANPQSEFPKKYVGIWEGDAYALGGNLPAGTFRVTIEKAEVGDRVGTFRSTDPIGGVCNDALVLKKVTGTQLVVNSIASEDNPSVCTTGEHEVRLTPVGKELQFEMDNADAGDPEARLAKIN
jgi:hypothetical protein